MDCSQCYMAGESCCVNKETEIRLPLLELVGEESKESSCSPVDSTSKLILIVKFKSRLVQNVYIVHCTYDKSKVHV